jgi:hypothetical protein
MAKDCMYDLVCKDRFDRLDERLDHIETNTNHYSRRPSWFISFIITGLAGLCVFLAQYIITH